MNKIVITLLILIIIAGGGYFGYQWWQDNNQPTTTNGTADDWKTYRNETYGFELTLTDAWEGYKTKMSEMVELERKIIYFRVPTQSRTHGYGDGYAEPFAISIYSISDWTMLQESGGPKPTYISRNSEYAFAYSQWQDPPEDLRNIDFKVSQIISTFKFTD